MINIGIIFGFKILGQTDFKWDFIQRYHNIITFLYLDGHHVEDGPQRREIFVCSISIIVYGSCCDITFCLWDNTFSRQKNWNVKIEGKLSIFFDFYELFLALYDQTFFLFIIDCKKLMKFLGIFWVYTLTVVDHQYIFCHQSTGTIYLYRLHFIFRIETHQQHDQLFCTTFRLQSIQPPSHGFPDKWYTRHLATCHIWHWQLTSACQKNGTGSRVIFSYRKITPSDFYVQVLVANCLNFTAKNIPQIKSRPVLTIWTAKKRTDT